MTKDLEYEKLKNSIFSINYGIKIKTVLLTSAVGGEGCSTVATNLADHLARNKALTVGLIDFSSEQPISDKKDEQTNTTESKDLTINKIPYDVVINKTKSPNLSVISNRKNNGNSLPIIETQKLNALVELKNEFDYLIFDYAPINTHPDIPSLASMVDGVILVIHAGKTRREVVQKAKEQLESIHAKMLGVVLNRTEQYIPEFIYKRL